jgi:hypothetical protein
MPPRRPTLTDKGVEELEPRTRISEKTGEPIAYTYAHPDPEMRRHYVRVYASGRKTFVVIMIDPRTRKHVWFTACFCCRYLAVATSRNHTAWPNFPPLALDCLGSPSLCGTIPLP